LRVGRVKCGSTSNSGARTVACSGCDIPIEAATAGTVSRTVVPTGLAHIRAVDEASVGTSIPVVVRVTVARLTIVVGTWRIAHICTSAIAAWSWCGSPVVPG
jgi:hypothetical protein